ncbi:unnamed protein product [Cuscuta campestris]|uniref:Uncharacterized protein n=1 Tax=Cuscuta campestris TaxID=132261 RepID=A0A484KKB4_9ASTE|nr:unnamed protein product [Cuscuta campestris]
MMDATYQGIRIAIPSQFGSPYRLRSDRNRFEIGYTLTNTEVAAPRANSVPMLGTFQRSCTCPSGECLWIGGQR